MRNLLRMMMGAPKIQTAPRQVKTVTNRAMLATQFRALLKGQDEIARLLADSAVSEEERMEWIGWAGGRKYSASIKRLFPPVNPLVSDFCHYYECLVMWLECQVACALTLHYSRTRRIH